jgi:hypothetical protein
MVQDPEAALTAVLGEILSVGLEYCDPTEEAEAVLIPAGLGR